MSDNIYPCECPECDCSMVAERYDPNDLAICHLCEEGEHEGYDSDDYDEDDSESDERTAY